MNAMLAVGSGIALGLLAVHSWKTRGRAVTVAFFLSAIFFGLLRGNAIGWLCRYLGGSSDALMPYIPQDSILPEIGQSSIQVATGWVFAMYLAWTVAELVLKRFGKGDSPPNSEKGTVPFSSRVFLIAGLASLFMTAICWCMETAAVAVGWWYWSLPTRSALFGNVSSIAMDGWFSVVPDFLIPFLVIGCASSQRPEQTERTERRARHASPLLRYGWIAVFPVHILAHLVSAKWLSHQAGFVLCYEAELLGVAALAAFSTMRMARGEISEPPAGRRSIPHILPGVALVIFFAVVAAANARGGAGIAGQLTLVPMVLLSLAAWRRVPGWVLLALSVIALAGWPWIGARALYSLMPVAVVGFLKLLESRGEPKWLRSAPFAAAVALCAVAFAADTADYRRTEKFAETWCEGDRLAIEGKVAEADAAYAGAAQFRPRDPYYQFQLVQQMMLTDTRDPKLQAIMVRRRLPRMIDELKAAVALDPDWLEPRRTLLLDDVLAGDIAGAAAQAQEMKRLRPRDAKIAALAVYFQKREEKGADLRFVARPDVSRDDAAWINSFAALGDWPAADQVRLYLEAMQFDPGYLPPHMNLARLYLNAGDVDRSVWHAKRAVELSKSEGDPTRRAQSLLLLGRALLASDKPDDAKRAFDEGRLIAPENLLGEFDRYR